MKINVPEGYEIDKSRSTDNEIFFKKKDKVTIDDVFEYINGKPGTRLDELGILGTLKTNEKVNAFYILSRIAEYYNKDWEPDWDDFDQDKFFIEKYKGELEVNNNPRNQDGGIYFKNWIDAKEVIRNPEFKQYIECLIP